MKLRPHLLHWISTVSLAAFVLSATSASAHFILVEPEAWMSQNALGDPQKVAPCGDNGTGTPTGKVTAFRPGETVEISINERIPHPGHYRVALAINDQSELPPPPPVAPVGDDPCGSVEIDESPTFPILADNLLPHTTAFDGPQTFTVTLPNDVTCTRCTLQVIEYMARHAQPCFYYHCAEISIQPGPAATPTPITAECAGDCDGSGGGAVNELVTLINISLQRAPIDACPAGDLDGDGEITISEIITAVNSLLDDCM